MTTLTRSRDAKVTNLVAMSKNTGNLRPAIANSFGLPSGLRYSCAGMTAFCADICYAGRLEKIRTNVLALLMKNFDALRDASRADMIAMLSDMIAEFSAECDKRNAEKIFRIHWDGDFFSPTYTTAWAAVVKQFPDVQFWVYTRVAPSATYLHAQKLQNLALYFSADRDNIKVARALKKRGILIAFVGQTFDDAPKALKGAVRCPENNRAIPIIDVAGSACARCGLCVNGRRDVLFSVTKK